MIQTEGLFRSQYIRGGHRRRWDADCEWNVVHSQTQVLRGVHVHIKHFDCLCLVQGRALFALRDLHSNSPTKDMITYVEMEGCALESLIIPPGVAHGFYFYEPSIHIYGVSEYWNVDDELGCHYTDPELAFAWPDQNPKVSERDANLPPLHMIMSQF
ncbi:MAG: dTDP-4-dehydrorhamnose 3,5-epimerase family protein [Saprospiraceae bacterium]|nr:dTDP-4-dehydrorhamnose 3,5-epimerase family protein [Saprospiraceae bacterium]